MNIIIVAAKIGYQVKIFSEAAQRLGLTVTLLTDRCHQMEDPWNDGALALRFEDPDLESLPELKADGIIAVGDQPAYIAALLAEKMALRFHPSLAMERATNKFLARQQFQKAGMRTPWHQLFKVSENPQTVADTVPYPCVLKPTGLSASRGVIRANNTTEFIAAFLRIRKLLIAPDLRDDNILVESFLPGREFAVEGLMTGGHFRTLAIFDKPDPLDGPFFEETIYVTPSRESGTTQQLINDTIRQAATAIGLTDGPIHGELRINGSEAWMLEVTGRPIGGLCAQALRFDGGVALEELLMRHAIGEDVSALQREKQASGVMMIPVPRGGILEGVSGIAEAKAVHGVDDVIITAKEGYRMIPLPEGSSYLGFIFARAQEPSQVEQILRLAHSKITVSFLPVLPVI